MANSTFKLFMESRLRGEFFIRKLAPTGNQIKDYGWLFFLLTPSYFSAIFLMTMRLGDRSTVGQRTLTPWIKVRILVSQPSFWKDSTWISQVFFDLSPFFSPFVIPSTLMDFSSPCLKIKGSNIPGWQNLIIYGEWWHFCYKFFL